METPGDMQAQQLTTEIIDQRAAAFALKGGVRAMGVILQAWYRQTANKTVPAPTDAETPSAPWWWDHIAAQAETLRLLGFTAILLPPTYKTNAGAFPGADGYGKFDDYDLGAKDQFYSIPTRYGSRERLQRLVAVAHAAGLDVYGDTVPHQYMGGKNGVYRYLGSDGRTQNGRFPKDPPCFVGNPPRVLRDIIPGPISADFSFGDEVSYFNSQPPGYMLQAAIDSGDWLTRTLDLQGYRIDDCKGISSEFVTNWANSKSMSGKFCVGEYYDGNPATLNWYIWNQVNGRLSLFDFTTHFQVQYMCNNTSRWDMSQLRWNQSLASTSPFNAVTFVENPDTDTDGFATVVWNKRQGYFWTMTTEGYPCVYYRDWSTDQGCYGWGLQPDINNYIWIHENLANGAMVWRFTDYQVAVYERIGQPGLLCGINNDMYNGWRAITVPTNFGPNAQLHDYTGHSNDIWTNAQGTATIWLPPNDNGGGTVAFSRPGLDRPFEVYGRQTVQTFEGAPDLDIGPVPMTGKKLTIGRVWCAAGKPASVKVSIPTGDPGWPTETQIDLGVSGKQSAGFLGSCILTAGQTTNAFSFTAPDTGWYTLSAVGTALASDTPLLATVTYTATSSISPW